MKTRIIVAGMLLPLLAAAGSQAETRKVVAGAQYKAGGSHRFFFGDEYRDIWTMPVTVEVLDLQKEAGGLTPTRRVGGVQTKGLALRGKDGGNYTFRGLDKDPSELLDEDFKGTIVEKVLMDQMAGQHPGSELVARGLLEAAGIPVPHWRLVVMPDDPALGQFQKDFAGAVGVFAEYPMAKSDAHAGFMDATEIIDHLTLYKRLAADPAERADTHAFLRARLMDILMGDWDRHRKQWRWARVPGQTAWVPIPEDRDQAFSRYEGLILSMVRRRDPRLQAFRAEYPPVVGLATNGFEQDRALLEQIPRETYAEAAKELQGKLTDDAIDRAVHLLPPEWYASDGPRLTMALKARRDALPKIADHFYLQLARRVDIVLTDRPEAVDANRSANGDLELTVKVTGAGAPAEPTFHRVFRANETKEIRLYTMGGDDKVTVTGGKGIKLRVIGGLGNDVVDDSQGGGVRLSDDKGGNKLVKGPGASDDERTYEPPPPPKNAPWVPPRDFGSVMWGVPWFNYNSDLGLFLGGGLEKQTFGFRKHPFAADHIIRAGWSFKESTGRVDYAGLFHRENSRDMIGFNAYLSGLETLRFYGFGNNTLNPDDKDLSRAQEGQVVLYPSYAWRIGGKAAFNVGPALRYSDNKTGDQTIVQQQQPYGFGKFGQAGLNTVFAVDTRDNHMYPRSGVLFVVRGTLWPEVWDVEKTFGGLSANLNTYISGGQWITLAVRGGGRRVFGDYPYRDAAYIGGGGLEKTVFQEPGYTVRGFRSNRFAGDSSLYGNADLRLRLGRITLLLPCHVGVFGLYDVGRVWLSGETSDTWHTSYGGGIWLSLLNYRSTFSAYLAHSKESNIFHVGGGFTF